MSIFLFDANKVLIGDIDPKDTLNHTQRTTLNGTITAAVTAVYSETIENAHFFGSPDVDDASIFWMYRITALKKYEEKIELTGIHILFDELQGGVLRDIRPIGVTASVALGRILDGTGWAVGINQSTGTNSATFYYQSRLSAFWDFLRIWGVEFRPRLQFTGGVITGRFIDIYNQISGDFGKWYEYGDKLINIVAEQANEGIYTALIGLGKGVESGDGFGRKITFSTVAWSTATGNPVNKPAGQDYVALPSAVAIYGHREAVVEFSDIEDPAALLTATYNELLKTSRPRVEFSAEALETGRVEIGETVTIIRDDLGIRYKTRVFELERSFQDSTVKSFRFGEKLTLTSAERIKASTEAAKAQEATMLSLYDQNRLAIIDTYTNEDAYEYKLEIGNEYGLPAGTYSFNAPIDQNPTSVIYYGAGRFLIANSKNPDNTWNWRTFGDGSGLGADLVTANNIAAGAVGADEIAAGVINTDHISATGISSDKIMLAGTSISGLITEKTKTFMSLPTPPYKVGDIWAEPPRTVASITGLTAKSLVDNGYTVRDLMGGFTYVCRTARASGAFVKSDWSLVSVDDQISAVLADRVTTAETKITNTAISLTSTTELVNKQGQTLGLVDDRLTKIQAGSIILSQVTNVDDRVTTMGGSIQTIDTRSQATKDRLTQIEAGSIILSQVTNVDGRVSTVDGKVATLNGEAVKKGVSYSGAKLTAENGLEVTSTIGGLTSTYRANSASQGYYDGNNQFIGGLAVVGGDLSVAARKLFSPSNPNVWVESGSQLSGNTLIGSGLKIFENQLAAEIFTRFSSENNFNYISITGNPISDGKLIFQKWNDFNGWLMSAGNLDLVVEDYGPTQKTIAMSILNRSTGVVTQGIGVDLSGPYYIKNSVKNYF